jgi:hypothetical protein
MFIEPLSIGRHWSFISRKNHTSGNGRVRFTTSLLFNLEIWHIMPLNSTSGFDIVFTQSGFEMLATTLSEFRKTIVERVILKRINKWKIVEHKDISIELRRYLAAEIANKEFEKRKDRALTENHRASFTR